MNPLKQLLRFRFGGHVEGQEDIDCDQAATQAAASAGRGRHA